MNMLRPTLLVLACLAAPGVFAQWQWIDKDGRKVFSDQPPPSSVPDNKIIKRAGARPAPAEPEPAAAAAAASAASMPKVSGKDKELEAKRKAASEAAADKKKQQEEEMAKSLRENCDRAKRNKALIDSGTRMATINAKGEREVLDDNARAAELKRTEEVIARDCKGAS